MSDSLQPHGLLCPWDSPGKNTGVGCHHPESPVSPALQADSLPSEPPGEPNNGLPAAKSGQRVWELGTSNKAAELRRPGETKCP